MLPESPVRALPGGGFYHVPVLTGGTRDEARLFAVLFWDAAGQPITAEGYKNLLADGFDAAADEVARQYPVDAYATPSLAWAEVVGDSVWARSVWDFAHAVSANTTTYALHRRPPPGVLERPGSFSFRWSGAVSTLRCYNPPKYSRA